MPGRIARLSPARRPERGNLSGYTFGLAAILIIFLGAPVLADEVTSTSALPVSTVQQSEQARGRQRDLGSEGDDRIVEKEPDVTVPAELATTELVFYGSGRVRLTANDGKLAISDNRSRVGMSGFKFINPLIDIFMRVELGTDLGRQLDGLLIPGENPPADSDGAFFPRIGQLGVGTPYGDLAFGKQWSTYYDVAGFTDRFAVFGAQGTAVYNAGTDGGGSGTGRADRALIYELNKRKISLGIQGQNNTDIPLSNNQQYDGGAGASLTYNWSVGLSIAAAYNHSFIDQLDADLIALGLTGDRQAAVVGVKFVNGPLFLATTAARHKNHEATDQLQYVDAWGWELYARYSFSNRFRVVGGANLLDPDDNDPEAGKYEVRSAILGLQYTYGNISLGDMIYFECELNAGHRFDGSSVENAYTVGIRYSFEL